MPSSTTDDIDTPGMVSVHNALRRALKDAATQLAAVPDGPEEARRYVDYLIEVLWLAGAHHDTEDELLAPKLKRRAPQNNAAWALITAQHHAVTSCLEDVQQSAQRFATAGSPGAKKELVNACRALYEVLDNHFSVEEQQVLPVAAELLTPAEWGTMSVTMLDTYVGTRPWLPFGLVYEALPPELQIKLLAQVPTAVSDMWASRGADAFAAEMAAIRGTKTPG
jgi:hemerythrin-like domain-containing protein